MSAPARPGHTLAAVALALLLGLQPVTTDLYLPALPGLTRELGATLTAAQLTMAALLLAFGIAQLGWGPLADRLGRKPVLLAGIGLNAAASLGGAWAATIEALIAWRVLQGVGLAAVVVCARALVRDLYEPHEGAQVMALGLGGLGLLALACPLVGGALAAQWGWRASLTGVGLFALALGAFIGLAWPETLAVRNPRATRLAPMLAAWSRIARHPRFLAWATLVACTYGGLFVVLAGSSFVFIGVLQLSPTAYGAALSTSSLAYIVGTVACRRWIRRHGLAGAVQRGAGFTAAGAAGAAACAAYAMGVGNPSPWLLLPPIWLYMFGHGSHQPCGQTGAVGPFPREAGAAAALAGFMLAALAFATGLWLGRVLAHGVPALMGSLAFFGVLTCAIAWRWVPRVEVAAASAVATTRPATAPASGGGAGG